MNYKKIFILSKNLLFIKNYHKKQLRMKKTHKNYFDALCEKEKLEKGLKVVEAYYEKVVNLEKNIKKKQVIIIIEIFFINIDINNKGNN